jgi:hypothetical protein
MSGSYDFITMIQMSQTNSKKHGWAQQVQLKVEYFLLVCLVPKFLFPNFTIYLSHQIFCLIHKVLNVNK